MIKNKLLNYIIASFLISSVVVVAEAQSVSSNYSESSFRRAKQIVNDGLGALGGAEALRSIKTISFKETGRQHHVNQDIDPYSPFGNDKNTESFFIDFAANRLVREFEGDFPGLKSRQKFIINGNESFTIDFLARTVRPFPNATVANQRVQLRKLPHLILFEALERATTLRFLGEANYKGRKHRIVSFVRADNQLCSLYFDVETNLLSKYEFLYTDNGAGDAIQEHIFPAYRTSGKFKVPTGRIMIFANQVWQEMVYEQVSFDDSVNESIFNVPADFAKVPPVATQTPGANQLAPDVYLLRGNSHHSLIVVFNEYVLVVDAPEPAPPFAAVSEGFIRRIKEIAPNKTIKYLIPTHHHSDHSGGVRAFVAEGSTIVTTPGNKRFFEELSARPFTFAEDALARNPRKPVFEIVENKKRIFRDDKHIVEIYDIGPSPHAAEMLIAYLPEQKILFQSDLFTVQEEQTPLFAQEATIHLANSIQRLGLDVRRIVGGHGNETTIEKLRSTVERK